MKSSLNSLSNLRKIKIIFTVAASVLFIAAALSLLCGSTSISFGDIVSALKSGATGTGEKIFLYIRLPRTLACIFVGAALSVSGAVIQNVLANRLASPGIIGVNSGAGLAVTLCSAFGIYGGWQLSFFSFLGAFFAAVLVSSGARHWGASRGTVILMGVAVNSLLGALSDTVITFNPDIAVMCNDFKAGDFSAVTYQKLIPGLIIISLSLVVLFTLSNELDILTLGEENASGLGINTRLMNGIFMLLSALLAGCAVSIAGLISFVGLLVPHAVRRSCTGQSKYLLPLCALFGGSFITVCDTASRTLFAPYEIPVGIIMAFTGAPFFIYILIKRKGGHSGA